MDGAGLSPGPQCPECLDTGYRTVERDWADPITGETLSLSFADPCPCPRGRKPPIARPPLTPEQEQGLAIAAQKGAEYLLGMKEFNRDDIAATTDTLLEICWSPDHVLWVVRRAIKLFPAGWETCGHAGLRQIYNSKFTSRDGDQTSWTEAYPDGIPSEQEQSHALLERGAYNPAALPAGRAASADPDLDQAVADLARTKSMPWGRRP